MLVRFPNPLPPTSGRGPVYVRSLCLCLSSRSRYSFGSFSPLIAFASPRKASSVSCIHKDLDGFAGLGREIGGSIWLKRVQTRWAVGVAMMGNVAIF